MTTCIFFGCDNELPNLPKGYGAGQWPVGWCEECNDKKRGHDTPDPPRRNSKQSCASNSAKQEGSNEMLDYKTLLVCRNCVALELDRHTEQSDDYPEGPAYQSDLERALDAITREIDRVAVNLDDDDLTK